MRVLIIGGTGIISTAISCSLLERGDELVLYNRGKTEQLFQAGAGQITGDRRNFGQFESQMSGEKPFDCVIDMVCYHPDEARSLIRAFKGRVGQLIFCSTVEVYTKPAVRFPIREEDGRESICEYGQNKAICEDLLMEAHWEDYFPVTIFRPAYTYGEGGDLIYVFGKATYLQRVLRGQPLIVPGDGNCLWAACHRDDVGQAFVNAVGNQKAFGRTYNVTGMPWMTWDAYHQGVAEAMEVPCPPIVHIPTDLLVKAALSHIWPRPDVYDFPYVFDSSAAAADLDFRCTIPWVEGARRTIDWVRERGRIESSVDDSIQDRLIRAWECMGDEMVHQFQS